MLVDKIFQYLREIDNRGDVRLDHPLKVFDRPLWRIWIYIYSPILPLGRHIRNCKIPICAVIFLFTTPLHIFIFKVQYRNQVQFLELTL